MRKEEKIILMHVIVPLCVGAMLYYLLSPEVFFVKILDGVLGGGVHFSSPNMESVLWKVIRNYFFDMLWGYALVFALFWAYGKEESELRRILISAIGLSFLLESLQIITNGTFDLWDLVVEFFIELLAICILKRLLRRNKR